MAYLLDTNILMRISERSAPEHAAIRAALNTLWARGDKLCFTSQKYRRVLERLHEAGNFAGRVRAAYYRSGSANPAHREVLHIAS